MQETMPDDIQKHGSRRALLLSVVIILLIVVTGIAFPHGRLAFNGWRFRHFGGKHAFLYVYQSLQNGEPIEKVRGLIGPGHPNNDPRYRSHCAKVYAANPVSAPSGISESDFLLGYSAAGTTIHFQFRDGQLINHTPTDLPFLESSLQ
jgi:hypothetical protein